ncbi:DUF4174 domain-containing protein [Sphingomonas sp. 10B4]|uniref:DUF4174 domain-containing protein n=1 Tax=Sphingomonas sp. 10B4 TaxID=3048575 RepID=UPI002AB564EF|nr:DUF4174 domain-containing protein [Sphingomonas sp. 10B4]MDY7523426.1 DUF4174 domain-containing protein [Sphingomonas sp. 10B4]MEB0281124.1 DUF4174 domain-containing protein [Sphingomonas sp. 10B4]
MLLAAAIAAATVADMRYERRVLIVAAPNEADARRIAQRASLDTMPQELGDRDVTVVEVTGDSVRGATDSAAALRTRWRLPKAAFGIVLVGKDGNAALRRAEPIDRATLVATIDAMPMRRAGQR